MRRLTLDDIALCLRAGESAAVLFDPAQVTVVPGDAPCTTQSADQLLDVDAGLTMAELTETARAAGYRTPLSLLPDGLRVFELGWRFPFVAEALFHSVSAVTCDGEPLHSPRAPRSAVGPDLLGAVLGPHPLAVATRVRLRAMPQSHCQRTTHRGSAAELAARLCGLVHKGAARWALLDEGVLHVVGVGTAQAPALDALRPPPMSGRAVSGSDALALEQAARTGRVLAFPYLGRAGVLRTDPGPAVGLALPAAAAATLVAATAQEGA